MRNELEKIIAEYGSFWAIALFSVGVSKLYSAEEQTVRTIIRSLMASMLWTYIFVEFSKERFDLWAIAGGIIAGSFAIDVIVEVLMRVANNIRKDPSILLKFIPYVGDKGGKK